MNAPLQRVKHNNVEFPRLAFTPCLNIEKETKLQK